MVSSVHRTQRRYIVRHFLVATVILGVSFAMLFLLQWDDSGILETLAPTVLGAGFVLGVTILFRCFTALFTTVRAGESEISLHRPLRRAIRIAYAEAVLAETKSGDRLRSLKVVKVTGAIKKQHFIALFPVLTDFDILVRFLHERIVKRDGECFQEYAATQTLPEGITIKIHSSVPFMFSLSGVFAVFFSIMWMRQPGEMASGLNRAEAVGLFVLGVALLVSCVLLYRTLRFDAYGVTMATFLYRVHIPWDAVRSCGWTPNRKKLLIRSDKAEIDCREAAARSKVLMDLITTQLPQAEAAEPLRLPFTLRTSYDHHVIAALLLSLVIGGGWYFFPQSLSWPIVWTPGAMLVVGLVVFTIAFVVWFELTFPLRYEFDANAITVVYIGRRFRCAVSTLREIQIDQSRVIQGEPLNVLSLFFEGNQIAFNNRAVTFPLSLLHAELQRLYFGKADSLAATASEAAGFPIPRKSPSPWPHGRSLHWRGLGAFSLYCGIPLALLGLGALALSGSALSRAVEAQDLPRIEALLEAGANPNRGTLFAGWAPMHDPKTPEILALLLRHGGDINVAAHAGATPLFEACRSGADTTLVAAMIAAGADVNHNAGHFRAGLPLQAAAYHGYTDLLALLLDAGARIEGLGHSGTTALLEAAAGGHAETVKLLLARGAEVNARVVPGKYRGDELSGGTALHYAARANAWEAAEALIAADADIEATMDNDWTPLHVAYDMDAAEVVALLISKGANQSAKTNQGYTPERLRGKGVMKERR